MVVVAVVEAEFGPGVLMSEVVEDFEWESFSGCGLGGRELGGEEGC